MTTAAPPKSETRAFPGSEIRAVAADDGTHYIDLRVLTYNTVDSYGSVWLKGCFNKGLEQRLPQLCVGHDWAAVIGRAVSWAEDDKGLAIRFRLDNFDDVPLARQIFAQVMSKTLDEASVGFSNTRRRDPTDEEVRQFPGAREMMEESELDESSVVLRGAVPGAIVIGARARVLEPMFRSFVDFVDGKRDLTETLAELRRAAEARALAGEDDGDPIDLLQACDAALDQADALLDGIDTSGLPAEVQQAIALMQAAAVAIDEALDVLGIDDPDEDSETADEMAGLDNEMAAALAGLKD
jgi:HK97 family phage prohead protease